MADGRVMADGRMPSNRWAAFTDDELDAIYLGLPGRIDDGYSPTAQALHEEMFAELERRKA